MTKIVIIVEGGCVSEVRSNRRPNETLDFDIIDLDSQDEDMDEKLRIAEDEHTFILA